MQMPPGHLLAIGWTMATHYDLSKGQIGNESVRGRARRAGESVRDRARQGKKTVRGRARQGSFQYLQLEKWVRIHYNTPCLREANTEKEVGKMFFFTCGNCCNNDCSSVWQILSQICGFGC